MLDKDLSNVIKCLNSLYFSGILLDSIYMEDFKTGVKIFLIVCIVKDLTNN